MMKRKESQRMARLGSAIIGCFVLCAASAEAQEWRLGQRQLIDPAGTTSSLWEGTVVYLSGINGALMYYDGEATQLVFEPDLQNHEPANANGTVAWRRYLGGRIADDIYRWDGLDVENVSQSSGIDSDLSAGSNGDLLWSRNHTWLMYYDAASGVTISLGVRGENPALYITEGGDPTFAYQDPDTGEVKYFDGNVTHTLGQGASYGADPCVWDGAVVWVGEGEGSLFSTSELFYWKDGVTVRITNDDDVGGIPDESPALWKDVVIWSRSPDGPFAPRLFLWDGENTVQLTTTGGRLPSFHNWQVSYLDADGLYLADVILVGDVNCDGVVNAFDVDAFILALTDPAAYAEAYPDCDLIRGDINDDGAVNAFDIDLLIEQLVGPQPEGACCLPDGDCEDGLTSAACLAQGGQWQGEDSTCDSVECPPPPPLGACCDGEGMCTETVAADCAGLWLGPDTTCGDDCDGDGTADACLLALGLAQDCQGNGVPDACDIAEGTSADVNGNGVPDECEPCVGQIVGDANCDGLVNAFDIDAFVLALTSPAEWELLYGGSCDLPCVGDCNQDGDVNAFDIDAFIALLIGG